VISHCKKELPLEACGLLSGRNRVIQSFWPIRNVDKSPYSFSMALGEIERVFHSIERKNEVLMGIYHSHPTASAYPSSGDIAYNNYPELAHVIISLMKNPPDIRAFSIQGTQVNPIAIQLM